MADFGINSVNLVTLLPYCELNVSYLYCMLFVCVPNHAADNSLTVSLLKPTGAYVPPAITLTNSVF